MTLLFVDEGGVHCPAHTGNGPCGQFLIQDCSFADESKAESLFDEPLHLRRVRCPRILLDLHANFFEQFEQPCMGLSIPLRVVKNRGVLLQIGWLKRRLRCKRMVGTEARKGKIPGQLRDTDTTTLSWDQLRMALNELSPRDRLLLELDMTNALRPSELFALKWKSFDSEESTMSVTETVYKGKIRSWGKTRKSLAVIHVPNGLSADLAEWRTQCPDPSPDAFIFSNQDGGFLDTDNYRKRVLHKLAKDLELPKLTFQVIRRTIATLAQKKGTVKDVQGVLRHSRTATTTDVYMQEIPESVQATVDSINRELRKSGPEKTSRTTPKRKSATAVFLGKRSSKGAMSEGVFENLTPNDTKRSEKEVACFR